MMPRARLSLLFASLIVLALPAPSAAQHPARWVRGPELVSSDLPALRIRVDSSFRLAGVVRFTIRDVASGERFVFVDAADGTVRRLVVAQFEAMLPTSRERYNYSFDQAPCVAGYRWRQNPFAFSQRAAIAENPRGEAALTAGLLREKGFRLADELVSVRYLTVPDSARRHELIVFYMEPLDTSRVRLDKLYTTSGDATLLWRSLARDLAERARAAFTIVPAHPDRG